MTHQPLTVIYPSTMNDHRDLPIFFDQKAAPETIEFDQS